MAKLTILKGLPASGKSTKAQEILKSSGNAVRVNKDLIREMLHFSKWTGINEDITKDAAKVITISCLAKGKNVIIDDTNLNEKTYQSWIELAKSIGVNTETIMIDTPIEECIKRDFYRDKKVGDNVIIGMAMSSGIYPKPNKGIVICDIDGTLANTEHRQHFVGKNPKDWKGWFDNSDKDELRLEVADMVLKFEEEGYEIFLVSGRPENYREQTEVWLENKFKGYRFYKTLFMRRAGDSRPDTQIKKEIYDKYFKEYNVIKVIDDRPSVIKMWREQELDVEDVGKGIDF